MESLKERELARDIVLVSRDHQVHTIIECGITSINGNKVEGQSNVVLISSSGERSIGTDSWVKENFELLYGIFDGVKEPSKLCLVERLALAWDVLTGKNKGGYHA